MNRLLFTTMIAAGLLATNQAVAVENTSIIQAENDGFTMPGLNVFWTWTDPKQDCLQSLEANPGWLRLSIAGRNHDLYYATSYNAPRLTQRVAGDFSFETRMDFQPRFNVQGAGLLIWQDSNNFVKLEKVFIDNEVFIRFSAEIADNYRDFAMLPVSGKEVYLRLERKSSSVSAYYSLDGKIWNPVGDAYFASENAVTAGVFVSNDYQDNPVYADFDYFRVHSL